MVAAGSGGVGGPAVVAPDEREVPATGAGGGDRPFERPRPRIGVERRDERGRGAAQPDAHDRGAQVELPFERSQERLVDRPGEDRIRGERRVP
jgi:hypothetical protein